MRKIIFSLLLTIFLFQSIVYASSIDSHKIIIALDDIGNAHITSTIVYTELTSIEFPYTVFGRVDNFIARDAYGILNCSLIKQPYGATYSCTPNGGQSENYTASFEYDVYNLVALSADAYAFSYVYGANTPLDALDILLFLPEGTGLVKDSTFKPYPEAIVGSTGRMTTLNWFLISPELGKTYTFTATYERLVHTPVVNYYGNYVRYIAAFFAAAFLIVLWRYWHYRKTNLGTVLSLLKADEKRVFDIVLESKGKCKQNTIVKGTNFSKAKVSRIISDLESRGLIEKIRIGRTNRIVVSNKKKKEVQKDLVLSENESLFNDSEVPKRPE